VNLTYKGLVEELMLSTRKKIRGKEHKDIVESDENLYKLVRFGDPRRQDNCQWS
jgi:hypothetical protein